MRRHIFLVGFMASGKSSVGPPLSDRLGLPFVDLDSLLEQTCGMSVREIFDTKGEPFFRQMEERLLQEVVHGRHSVIALGGGTFVRSENRCILRGRGISVWLKIPLKVASERCLQSTHRPLASDPERLRQLFQAREKSYRRADLIVEVAGKSVDQICLEIMAAVRRISNFPGASAESDPGTEEFGSDE